MGALHIYRRSYLRSYLYDTGVSSGGQGCRLLFVFFFVSEPIKVV